MANGGLVLETRMLAARFVVSGFGCLFLLGGDYLVWGLSVWE